MTTNTYRVARGPLLACLGGTLLFGSMAVLASLFLVAPDVVEAPDAGVGGWLFFGLGAAFAIAMACVCGVYFIAGLGGRLTVSPDRVEWTSRFRRRQVSLSQVVEARWRRESLLLRTPREKLSVGFGDYPARQQPELIRFFRFALSEDVQHGWERFWLENWGLFDRPDPDDPAYWAEWRANRRRLDTYFALGLVLMAVTFVWQWTLGVQNSNPLFWRQWSGLPLFYGFLWCIVHFAVTPRKGNSVGGIVAPNCRPIHRQYPPPSTDHDLWFILPFLLAFYVLILVVGGALQWAGWHMAAAIEMWAGGCALLLALFVAVFIVSRRMKPWQREREAWRREAARLAEQEYMTRPDGA
ncbi:MAG: hypothetical protein JW809_18345 [Pirellulales bacterium]|nr:hypothetical protein [Pirellulales bacterium]